MNYYDSIANGYDDLHKAEQLNKLKLIKEHLEIKPNDKMLDVGCGPGYSANFFNCDITGIDPSIRLLEKAHFKTVLGQAEKMPFKADEFDVVISVTAIQNFTDFKRGLLEIKRVGNDRFAFSILRKFSGMEDLAEFIRGNFKVLKELDEVKDVVFICKKN